MILSETEALERILAGIEPLSAEEVAIPAALGRFAAEPVFSPTALPRFDQSAMDGYALRCADTPGELRQVGEQPAGRTRHLEIAAGETVRIFTGAPLPEGADAVVMQEDARTTSGRVRIAEAIAAEEFIRRRGEDVCEGQQLIARGELVTPARIGLLHAAGVASISIHRRPRAAIVSTGDELREAGSALQPGELYDSNRPMLTAQLNSVADIIGSVHCPDDPAALGDAIRNFAAADAIILNAGVSVGDHDPVHEALRIVEAEVALWRVAVKPGKPFLFARRGGQAIYGLPGNPVSAFVTAVLFVLPALRRLAGSATPQQRTFQLPIGSDFANPDKRVQYVRATFRGGVAQVSPLQQSHGLASLAASDLLLRIPPGETVSTGDPVEAMQIHL